MIYFFFSSFPFCFHSNYWQREKEKMVQTDSELCSLPARELGTLPPAACEAEVQQKVPQANFTSRALRGRQRSWVLPAGLGRGSSSTGTWSSLGSKGKRAKMEQDKIPALNPVAGCSQGPTNLCAATAAWCRKSNA